MRSLVALLAASVALSACGGSERVTVFAAASLTDAFEALEGESRFNFAGSDELAVQIREAGGADVFASASPRYTQALFREGLVWRPRTFATNRLVLIVPRDGGSVGKVADLAEPDVRLVLGGPTVPVGEYARVSLGRLGLRRALENVVSEERDVKGVVAKVVLGEADAGIVYATDVATASEDLRALPIPARGQVPVRYEIAVVRETGSRKQAEAFVRLVLGPKGRRALREAGFGVP